MLKKKISKLIIGSNNQGKIREIRKLLPSKIKLYTPKKLEIRSPKENGISFAKNSFRFMFDPCSSHVRFISIHGRLMFDS